MLLRYFLFYLILITISATQEIVVDPIVQWENCNNCYAVVARDVLLWHRPKYKNITLHDMMKLSHQTCNGGIPTRIWDLYFQKKSKTTAITKAVIQKLQKLIQLYGPVVINKGKEQHLVTVFKANQNGILVRDPRTLELEIWSKHKIQGMLPLTYVAYPKVK